MCGVMETERVRSILDEELRAAIFNTYLPPPPALLTQSSVQAHRTVRRPRVDRVEKAREEDLPACALCAGTTVDHGRIAR